MSQPDFLDNARSALAQTDWEEARAAFEKALDERETAEAHDGLGWALWWLERPEESFEHRQRAYHLWVERGETRRAARVAIGLAPDIADFQGSVVAGGWLRRARSLLDEVEPGPEHGWLALWEGHFARLYDQDLAQARERAGEAARIARQQGLAELELLATALDGVTQVSEGEIREGMRRLDEATAATLSGEVGDLDAAGQTCCLLLHACTQVRDYDRATQWTRRVTEFSRRWNIRPLYAVCRAHYAEVELGRGEWTSAEIELERVLEEMPEISYPVHSEARLLLGELRRRQGRVEEAEQLFRQAETWSLSMLGRAAIALDEDDAAAAASLLRRGLRVAAPDNFTLRASGMARLVRAFVALEDLEGASAVVRELDTMAEGLTNAFVTACARLAAGRLAMARQEVAHARRSFEEAVDIFSQSGAPYEAGRARLELARALAAVDRPKLARAELEAACEALERLGARCDHERAERLLTELDPDPAGSKTDGGPLTERETEVLALVAEGLSDKEVASRLHLSSHTVHRHVANILTKLEAPSRTAAVAYAVRRGLI